MAKKSRVARKKQAAANRKTVTAAQNVKKAPAVEAVKEEKAAVKTAEEAEAAEAARKAEEEAKAAEAARKAEEEAKASETARKAEEEAKAAEEAKKEENDRIFAQRLERHHDELRWLYMELYGNDDIFAELFDQMKRYYDERNDQLKTLDSEREAEGAWYRKRDMLGMLLPIDSFPGNINCVQA